MIVKICGIKTLEIALAAVEAGADMLGFNFYPPSSRYITPEKCAEIISRLPTQDSRLTTVGVFVNKPIQRVLEIIATCNLHLAQLAGDESPQDLAALDGKAFKAVRPNSLAEANNLLQAYYHPRQITPLSTDRSEHPFIRFKSVDPSVVVPALLVDAHVKGAYGGTGETGDWAIAQYLAAQAPILLAGGLNPENVAAAVQAVNPWGVDVASGVESSPGVKDPAKISGFISAARAHAKN